MSQSANTPNVRRELEEVFALIPAGYRRILENEETPAKLRFEVMRDLMDRFGPPVVRATLSQSVSAQLSTGDVKATRDRLLEEQRRVLSEIKALKGELKEADDDGQAGQGRLCGQALPREGQGQDDQEVQDEEEGPGNAQGH